MTINRQMTAVMRRPVHSNQSAIVRARSPMVYQRAAQRKQNELDERNYRLAEREQKHAEYMAGEDLKFREEQHDEAKRRNRIGEIVTLGTGLSNVYFGYKQAQAAEESAEKMEKAVAGKGGGKPEAGTPKTAVVPGAKESASAVVSSTTPSSGLMPTIKDGLSNWGDILKGGGIGMMASQFGSGTGQKALIGAGAGAVSNWVMGGGLTKLLKGGGVSGSDMVSAAASGILGALGGFV